MRTTIIIPTSNDTGNQFNVTSVYLVNAVEKSDDHQCILSSEYVGYVGRNNQSLWGYTEQLEDFLTADFTHATPAAAADALVESQANVVVY